MNQSHRLHPSSGHFLVLLFCFLVFFVDTVGIAHLDDVSIDDFLRWLCFANVLNLLVVYDQGVFQMT